MPVRIAPTLAGMATYPFVQLEEARRRLVAQGIEVIDFGKGDPNEPTDPIIRRALVDAVPERAPYPLAAGLPELREAAARWCRRRFGVDLDPDTELVPTYGAKEAIFSLAQVLVDPASGKRVVAFGEPAYPVYERGALQVAVRSRVIVCQTLSKRSSMTGYRSGFVAGPADVIAALKTYRPTVGTAPQEFVQRASVVAWDDERHVAETRARYAAKRD